MMGVCVAATRHTSHLTRVSSPKPAAASSLASFIQQRRFATSADHQSPTKVNFWQDPLHPSRWKEEHFVIVSLAGWAAMIYGGYNFFAGKKNDKKDKKIAESPK